MLRAIIKSIQYTSLFTSTLTTGTVLPRLPTPLNLLCIVIFTRAVTPYILSTTPKRFVCLVPSNLIGFSYMQAVHSSSFLVLIVHFSPPCYGRFGYTFTIAPLTQSATARDPSTASQNHALCYSQSFARPKHPAVAPQTDLFFPSLSPPPILRLSVRLLDTWPVFP